MRLIDADALAGKCCIRIEEFGTCEKCLEYYAVNGNDRICWHEYRGEDVRHAPTIDAIPVEWLQRKRKEALQEGMRPDEVEAVEMVLWMWHKEQEER